MGDDVAVDEVPLLELRDVHAAYGRIEVLRGVELQVRAGEVVAVFGPNGAGKSTTINVVSGRLVPTSGHLHIAGRHVNGITPDAIARAGLCTIPEGRSVFPNLTVEENLTVFSNEGTDAAAIRARAYDRFPRLSERRTQLVGTMSGGEQQMVALARAIGTDPAILVLDELSMGLAPMLVAELYDEVARVAAEGIGVLLVEQFASVVSHLATRAIVMRNGEVAFEGSADEAEAMLADAYLGG